MHTISVLEAAARGVVGLQRCDGWTPDRVDRELRRSGCGAANLAEIRALLVNAGLLREVSGSFAVTRNGTTVATNLVAGSWREFAEAVLELDFLAQQLRQAMPFLERSGELLVADDRLASVAPQLLVVLKWVNFADSGPGRVAVPTKFWETASLQQSTASRPGWVEEAQAVGHRAEQYALFYERSQKAPSLVLHVASDSDRYGYDIEDRTGEVLRAIEVKGARGRRTTFHLSSNQHAVASRMGRAYEISFWGEIDLTRDMATEYPLLRSLGYPRTYQDPIAWITSGRFETSIASWLVSEADGD